MKLNDKIKLAIALYFRNRQSQYKECRIDGEWDKKLIIYDPKAPKWDKEADQRNIDAAATKAGFDYSAAPGTFWFSKNGRTIECTESNYLDGGKLLEKRKKEKKLTIAQQWGGK